jgi:hypothetical protein
MLGLKAGQIAVNYRGHQSARGRNYHSSLLAPPYEHLRPRTADARLTDPPQVRRGVRENDKVLELTMMLDEGPLTLRSTECLNEFPDLSVSHLKSRTDFSPRLVLEPAVDLLALEHFMSAFAFEEVVDLLV